MSTLREQFSAARKAQVEIQLDFVRNLTNNVFDSTGKVVALNLSTGRNSIEKSTDTFRKLVTAKSPRELVDLSVQSQAGFDTLLNYGSELFNIASRAQADLIKAATPAAAAVSAAPAQALRALPTAQVEVEVQAEVPGVAEADVVTSLALDDTPAPQAAAPAPQPEPAPEPVIEAAPAPQAEPVLEAAPAIEIVDEVPVPDGTLKAAPLAEAVSEAVGQGHAPVLEAAPLVTPSSSQVEISGIEPIEATPPHAPVSGNPLAQDKAESAAPKSRRKK